MDHEKLTNLAEGLLYLHEYRKENGISEIRIALQADEIAIHFFDPYLMSRSLRMFEIDGAEKEDVAKYLEKKIPDIIRMLKENKKQ